MTRENGYKIQLEQISRYSAGRIWQGDFIYEKELIKEYSSFDHWPQLFERYGGLLVVAGNIQ